MLVFNKQCDFQQLPDTLIIAFKSFSLITHIQKKTVVMLIVN